MNPEFLMVLPADIKRLGGADAAAVLALIRYATEFDDGRHGRVTVDGAVGWRASYADISAATGLSYQTVRRVASKLENVGAVTVLTTFGGSDRTRIYIPSDQSTVDSNTPADQSTVDSNRGSVDSNSWPVDSNRGSVDSNSCTTYMRIREGENLESAAPAPVAPLPLAVEEPLTPPGKAKTAATRKRNPKAPMPDDFTASDSEINKILAMFPNATAAAIARETFKFINHYQGTGECRPGWLASWRKWMAMADERGNFTANSGTTESAYDRKKRKAAEVIRQLSAETRNNHHPLELEA